MSTYQKWFIPFFLFFIVLLFALNVAQGATDSACVATTQSVYFGNGVWVVSEKDAADSKDDMEDLFRGRMATDVYAATKFDIAYNRSLSRVGDVIESARQILGNEYPTLLVARLLGISRLTRFLIPNSLEQQLNDVLRNEAARSLLQGQTSAADVAIHVGAYQADIAEGRKVVVVAHSQGNLFVNLAYDQLTDTQRNSFAMAPVASPDTVAKRSLVGHVTFANDKVIDLVQIVRLAAGLLPALLPNDFAQDPQTFWAHEFSENYLTDASAQEFIVGGVLITLAGLPIPPTLGQSGIITVTLTWGPQPDVDLHVFEPDGTHVYYANLQGTIGFLDVDDVTSFGPEHYFASCTNLTQLPNGLGTYRVGVNYFRGTAPETAHVNIKVPGADRSFDVNLPTSLGTSGNATPVPVANIVVTKDSQTGLLRFDVTAP